MKFLIVVDMQNDFINGALGTKEAEQIVPYVKSLIENFDGKVLFTRDTHFEDYMNTAEGKIYLFPTVLKGLTVGKSTPSLTPFAKPMLLIK